MFWEAGWKKRNEAAEKDADERERRRIGGR